MKRRKAFRENRRRGTRRYCIRTCGLPMRPAVRRDTSFERSCPTIAPRPRCRALGAGVRIRTAPWLCGEGCEAEVTGSVTWQAEGRPKHVIHGRVGATPATFLPKRAPTGCHVLLCRVVPTGLVGLGRRSRETRTGSRPLARSVIMCAQPPPLPVTDIGEIPLTHNSK